ncbi:hypothetical protein N7497_003958 [Penicillium chrysogenum]|nr:hypothetical protein N7497_003958 [Penicillium chrysogenum]
MPLIVLCRIFKSGFRRPLEVTTLIPTDHAVSNILLNLSSEQVRQILNSLGANFEPLFQRATIRRPQIAYVNHTGALRVSFGYGAHRQVMGMLNAAEVTAFQTALSITTLLLVTHIPKKNIVCFGPGQFKTSRSSIEASLAWISQRKMQVLLCPPATPHVNFRLVSREVTPDFDTMVQLSLIWADVVFCCTPSIEPLFAPRDLASSPKSRSIGSYKPHIQETDTETLLSSGQIFVDSKDACLQESGEPITANVKPHQLAEIGVFIASGKGLGIPSTGNIIFKCDGIGRPLDKL